MGSLTVRKDYAEGRFRVKYRQALSGVLCRNGDPSQILTSSAELKEPADTSRIIPEDPVSERGPEYGSATGAARKAAIRHHQLTEPTVLTSARP